MVHVRERVRWQRRLDALCAHPDALRLVLHPVVDVTAGRVAGYEVLSRFDSAIPTEEWFRAARLVDRGVALDLLVLRAALPLRERLPHGTFLTVNASPTSLQDPRVMAMLLAEDLTGVVLELTEHSDCDPADLVGPLASLRARGAKIALDDVGTGHSGLLRMAVARPEMVKVDLQLVRGLESDLVKRSLVQFLGECAGRLDAWIVAEGVETTAELDVLRAMGVPLVQGYLLARPGPEFVQLGPAAVQVLRTPDPRPPLAPTPRLAGQLARRTKTSQSIAEAVQASAADAAPVVVVDQEDVPQVIVLPGTRPGERPRVAGLEVVLAPETAVADAATRAVSRSAAARFDPLVCTDGTGRFVGVVGVEDVVMDLTRTPVATPPRLGRDSGTHIGGDVCVLAADDTRRRGA